MYKLSQIIVEILAKLYLKRFKPQIIGITGNAGKTSTKEAIGAVVGTIKKVRIGGGNLNNEIGLPFNIISNRSDEYYNEGGNLFFGIKSFFLAIVGFFKSDYPEILVMEYGADRPGDIKKLAAKYKPHISVVTTVGEIPVHIEFFKDAEELAAEKLNLVKILSATDYAVLNHDDDRVLDMKFKTKAKVATFGFEENSTIRVSDFEFRSGDDDKPLGVTFKLHQGPNFVPVNINSSLGKSQAYAAAAAAAVGNILGMNLVQISEALSNHHGPRGRLKTLKGIKNSTIIDDTYNASPASMRLALETLRDLSAQTDLAGGRKIAVLGDMLELGEHTVKAHQNIGTFAATFADILICIGSRAKFIAEAASDQMSKENIFTFETSQEAKEKTEQVIREHDLILVKGSQGMRMEKIVEEIMAEPEKKKELLVRQSKKWLAKK